jgi:hypothetical protein
MKRLFLLLVVAVTLVFVVGCESQQVREETRGEETKKETSDWEPVIK